MKTHAHLLCQSFATIAIVRAAQGNNTTHSNNTHSNTTQSIASHNITQLTNCTVALTRLGLNEVDLRCNLNATNPYCSQLNLRNISVISQPQISSSCNISIQAADDDQCISRATGTVLTFDALRFFLHACANQTQVIAQSFYDDRYSGLDDQAITKKEAEEVTNPPVIKNEPTEEQKRNQKKSINMTILIVCLCLVAMIICIGCG